jgi:hypothetical protein
MKSAGKINWRDFPLPTIPKEQLEKIVLDNINRMFEQDFEDWFKNYREAKVLGRDNVETEAKSL